MAISILARKVYQHVASIPSEIAFHHKSRTHPRALDGGVGGPADAVEVGGAIASKAAAAIRDRGCFVTDLETLGAEAASEMRAEAARLFERLRRRAYDGAHDAVHTISARREDLSETDQIFAWGLNDDILRIVSLYLGEAPAYDAFSAYYSRADGRQAGPRLWHRDREDVRMVKVAVYLTDVDEMSGPYEIVKPHYGQRMGHAHFEAMTDGRMRAALALPESVDFATRCTGPAGTVIFSDTALHYHRGRPPVSRDREAIFFSYFSRRPRYPFFCERSAFSRGQLRMLAASLSPAKRECVLWRDNLSWRDLLIPRNRVTV